MSKPKISLVVGNGLSMSFGHFCGLVKDWDSQKPLSWAIKCPSNDHDFLDSLQSLKKIREKYIQNSDFDIFSKTLDNNICEKLKLDSFITSLEARHFLTIAFSHYSHEQIKKLNDFKKWPWYKWMNLHKNEISSSFSLNYDLLLESIFDDLGKQYYSLQVNHHGYGIPLVKPHGSVDFEIHPNSISYSPTYPLTNFIDLNNTPIVRLDSDNLIYPRSQPLCIIPNESNKYTKYQWVAPANEWFNEEVSKCTHCIFIGISYFECDRSELDAILNCIPAEAQIIIANPNPPPEFIEKLKGRAFIIWNSYEGPINSTGSLLPLKDMKTGNLLKNCFCKSGLSYQYCCGTKTKSN